MKIDDNLPDHPKLWKMEKRRESALFLFIFALCYSSRNLTDGEVPCGVLEGATRGGKQTCAAMVEAGLLEEKGSSYVVHDYLEWNRSKDEIENIKSKKRSAGQAGGQASARRRACATVQAKSNPDTDTDTDTDIRPKPSCPKPAKTACLDGFDSWWDEYPRKEGKGAARKAYATALKKSDAQSLFAGLTRSARAWADEGRTRRLIPLPTTWLNQERWTDDYTPAQSDEDAYLAAKYGGAS